MTKDFPFTFLLHNVTLWMGKKCSLTTITSALSHNADVHQGVQGLVGVISAFRHRIPWRPGDVCIPLTPLKSNIVFLYIWRPILFNHLPNSMSGKSQTCWLHHKKLTWIESMNWVNWVIHSCQMYRFGFRFLTTITKDSPQKHHYCCVMGFWHGILLTSQSTKYTIYMYPE